FISDLADEKLEIARSMNSAISPINSRTTDLKTSILKETDGWGADIVFEATGSADAAETVFQALSPTKATTSFSDIDSETSCRACSPSYHLFRLDSLRSSLDPIFSS
ncbi:hypothetical protein OAQ47_06935, partial [Paracoccaceae bacterium]|nr:hypothetical protein [Paracoccaceae bacterium]